MARRHIWFRRPGEQHSRCVVCGLPRDPKNTGPCPGQPKEPQS